MVAVQLTAFRQRATEVQAHIVAVAGIKHIAVLDTDTVAGNAADVVSCGVACKSHGDILTAGDAVGQLALGGAEGLGVVAVVDADRA